MGIDPHIAATSVDGYSILVCIETRRGTVGYVFEVWEYAGLDRMQYDTISRTDCPDPMGKYLVRRRSNIMRRAILNSQYRVKYKDRVTVLQMVMPKYTPPTAINVGRNTFEWTATKVESSGSWQKRRFWGKKLSNVRTSKTSMKRVRCGK
jgi:hypothetical protein